MSDLRSERLVPVDRLTAARGLVSDHNWADLQDLVVLPGSFADRFPHARIPLLEEVLPAVPDTCRLCVEIKSDPQFPSGAVARRTLECLREANALDRTRIIAFDIDDLRAVLRLSRDDPSLKPAEFGVLGGKRQLPYWKDWAEELNATTIHFEHRVLLENPTLIEEAHTLGYKVNAWTVNDAQAARTLAELGVNELTTDDPALLRYA